MSTETDNTIYGFTAKRLDGTEESLTKYQGQVALIVNVASRCVFTSQYKDLQRLYDSHKDRGFVILGFPCNQFGAQEPSSENQIADFCSTTYNVTFPMFSKVDVNGTDAHPLYKYLKAQQPGLLGSKAIKWNFTKFLVSRAGTVIARYSPTTSPSNLEQHIVDQLG
jgi:glutathione peroxidase